MHKHLLRPALLPGIADAPVAGAVRSGERVFLSGANALQGDKVAGLGDPAAQANAALDRLEQALSDAGGSLASLTRLTTCVVDRGYRSEVYAVIARRLPNVRPVSTGLVVAGLPLPEMIVQIDAEAAIPAAPPRHTRPYTFDNWHGQGFPWAGLDGARHRRGILRARPDRRGPRPFRRQGEGPHRRRRRRAGRSRDDQPCNDPGARPEQHRRISANSRSISAIVPGARRSIR